MNDYRCEARVAPIAGEARTLASARSTTRRALRAESERAREHLDTDRHFSERLAVYIEQEHVAGVLVLQAHLEGVAAEMPGRLGANVLA